MNALRDSGAHPNLDTVFAHMQLELAMAIDIVENPLSRTSGVSDAR